MVHRLKNVFEAKTFFSRLTGLMGRKKWPSTYRGLYFPRCSSLHTFFTFLKPDLLFIDANHKILKIFPSADPWRFFFGPKGSTHCLELSSGSARVWKLKVGDRVRF